MSPIGLQTMSDKSFDPGINSPYRCHLSTTQWGIEMRKHYVAFAALLLAGCVSMGTDYDAAAVDRLRIGMAKAEVVQMLGRPNQVITNSDGTERLIWAHSTGSAFGAKARSVGLPFGTDGKLTDVPKKVAE